MDSSNIVTLELLAIIKSHYMLDWNGRHGIMHWSRVYENGVILSTQPGVNSKVVQMFSIFHDSQRENDQRDPCHGYRGAELALKYRDILPLNDYEFDMLLIACMYHTVAKTDYNITIGACFDSDRLDLGRVGKYPDPNLLSTPLAKQKDTIEASFSRSLYQDEFPDIAFGDINKELLYVLG